VKEWRKPGSAVKFWRQVFWFIRHQRINLEGLIQFIREDAKRHNKTSSKQASNVTNVLIHGLLLNRGSNKDFCDNLSIATRTGNSEILINVIRERLATPGLRSNLVPSTRSVRQSTAIMVRNFIALCKPRRTYSGFSLDLVSCVKVAAFLLHRITSVIGLRVDIWGDGCEIGGFEITRMTFRLLFTDAGPSAQSSEAVFCFAGMFIYSFILK
jgi:hypothetical protein